MSISNKNNKRQFGLICFCTFELYLLAITIFLNRGYPILEFLYCLPVIVFQMFLQYLFIWRPKINCGLCYPIFNGFTAVTTIAIFLGVYFGLFNYTMQYHMQDAQDCKVIGRQNTKVQYLSPKTELYSTLYINFILDGEQYLGYGCLSSRSNSYPPQSIGDPVPYDFLYKGQKTCILHLGCTPKYDFNEVKLPSWMCLPFDTDYEKLISLNKCYVNFFNNGVNGKNGSAYENARNRKEVNKSQSFALTTFSKVLVPYDQYLWLLMMTFCPIFPAISIIFFLPTEKIDNFFIKIVKEYKDDID